MAPSAERFVRICRYSSRTRESLSATCAGRRYRCSSIAATIDSTPTITSETRQLVASATMPAQGDADDRGQRVHADDRGDRAPALAIREVVAERRVAVRVDDRRADPGDHAERDREAKARRERGEDGEDAHDDGARHQEALAAEPVGVRSRE